MKTRLRKNMAIALSLSLCTTALIGISMIANAAEEAPAGYTAAPTQNVYLNPGEFYQQFYGAEDGEEATIASAFADTPSKVSETVKNSGSKSLETTFHPHGEAAGRIGHFDVTLKQAKDFSQAKYFQVWVDSEVDGFVNELVFVNVNKQTLFQQTEQNIMLFDQNTGKWSKAVVAAGTLGVKSIQMPAGFKGIVRYDLSEASTGAKGILGAVNEIEVYAIAKCANGDGDAVNGKKIYFDDFSFVTYNGATAPAYVDKPDFTGYTDDPVQNVQLNPGEIYKQVFGAETGDATIVDVGQFNIATTGDVKNSDSNAVVAECSDGSAMGFKILSLTFGTAQNWSNAKYLQFWMENTAPENANPLELFYMEAGSGGVSKRLYDHGFTGAKLYNQRTGKWSDIEVEDNSFHVLDETSKTPVPTLKIPAGFKGFVRIPLTNAAVQSVLANVNRFQAYIMAPGTPGPTKYYFDDIGLVSYTSATAPVYVDGTPEPTQAPPTTGTDTTTTDGSSPDFGEDTTSASTTAAESAETGVQNYAMIAAILLVISAFALACSKSKVKQ